MAAFVRNVRQLVREYLAFKYNESHVGTPTTNETASLLDLNNGYRRYLQGDYVDETNTKQAHVWSFAQQLAQIALVTGDEAYDLPDAYEGNIDPFIYDYDTLTLRQPLEIVSPSEILALRRDDNVEGQPIKCSVRAKDYSATAGSVYEWICYPKPEGATVTQVTTTVTRVTGPDFHSGLVGTSILITGKTTVVVATFTDADTLVVTAGGSQTVSTATAAFYENGLTIRYRYRLAFADLTDVATSIPAGLTGCGALIIQAAKMDDEQRMGAKDGSETARFYRMMGEMVRRDKAVIPGSQNLQKRVRQGGRRRWPSRFRT